MKRILLFSFVFLVAILEVAAQYQVSITGVTNDGVSMRCIGYGKKASIASQDAELAAIKMILFVGVKDSPFSMPLVQEDKTTIEGQFERFFDTFYQEEYRNFIQSSMIVVPYGKNALKQKCITMDVCVRVNQLRTYLEKNGIIRKFGL